jgi:hypothetical protein
MRRRISVLLLGFAMVGAAAAPAHAAIPAPPSSWFKLPGLNYASGAQWVRALAYGTPPNVVYAGLEGGGVFRSVTGGASWSSFNAGFPSPATTKVRALLTSGTGTTVYAGTDSGVFKSTGGGAWAPLAQGPEDDPDHPKKLNESVQSLASVTGGPMLAGVFSGGVYRSTDDGATWIPPAENNGMPASATIYGLTSTIPGVVYATGAEGVYVSLNAGASWSRITDGIPDSATPLTTWAYPNRPQILYTSTASNGIYQSNTAGATWFAINDGLGAVRARGFQIFPSSSGAHLYAATEDGLWEAFSKNTVAPPPPRWRQVTQDGLIEPGSSNVIMWSLTTPSIPGAGALGLIAGTQSNGGYFLSFEPPDSPCPTTPNATSDCPRVNGSVQVGRTLSASRGKWTGTGNIDYAYQWQRCTGTADADCSNIADAEESTYTVPKGANDVGGVALRYRVVITATNPAPTFPGAPYTRKSQITAGATANPADFPGANQTSAPSISVLSPGETTSPEVGDTMYAEYGLTPSVFTDGWFNPKATTYSYRWLRCESGGNNCNEIPGATARTYTLQVADGTHELRVIVRGINSDGSAEVTSGTSYFVISSPAAIAAPLPPDTPGGATKSQAPSLSGNAWVGETLAGSVGGWKDPTTDFVRRWVRCNATGGSCAPINRVNSVEPESGSTYVVRAGDLGSTIRLRVTADVNNDLTPDGIDNHLPHAVEIDSAASAVVANRPPKPAAPSPGGPGGGGGGGGAGGSGQVLADTTAPVLGKAKASKKSFVAGKSVTFTLLTTEAGSLRVIISKPTKGRKVSGVCKPQTKKNKKKKSCTYGKVLGTLSAAAPSGTVSFAFNGKLGKKKLAPGSYTATFVVVDTAGNASTPTSLTFKIKKR